METPKLRFEQIPVADVKKIAEIHRDNGTSLTSSPDHDSTPPVPPRPKHGIRFFESGLELIKGKGDLRKALGALVQLAAEGARSQAASLYVVDYQESVLKPLVTYGLPEVYVEACGDVRIGEQCCGRAVQHLRPWVVSDMLSDPLFTAARNAAVVSPIRSAFSVPVIDSKQVCIGSLACHFTEPHTPSREDLERNQTWATLIAHTISEYKLGIHVPHVDGAA